jgi:hypothetical protein
MTQEKDSQSVDETSLSRRELGIIGGSVFASAFLPKRLRDYLIGKATAQSTGEPRINLGDKLYLDDSSGTLTIGHVDNGSILKYDPSSDKITAIKNLKSFSAGAVDITGESYAKGHLSTDITGISANTWENIIDTVDVDNLGEFNSSYQFIPNETGEYEFRAIARWGISSGGDRVSARIYDVTNSNSLKSTLLQAGGGGPCHAMANGLATLRAGNAYELQSKNLDSSDDIQSGDAITNGSIKRSVVHQ